MAKNDSQHPCGSQWRKWDLHVHSPASANFMGDWPGFVIQVGNSDCAVIGINDYFSVAGYKELLRRLNESSSGTDGNQAYREALEKLRGKTLLPVVECRMTNVVLGKKNTTGQRINFHIIFSDEVNPDDIETFLKGIKVKDQSIGSRYTDSNFLLNEVSVDFKKVLEHLNGDATFKGRFVIWIPYDEYGGIGDIDPKSDKLLKEGLVYDADILGSGSRSQADFFLWKDPKYSEAQYKGWFGKRKPCIKGSDSHNMNEEIGRLKDRDSKPADRACWIKADPTFMGLRQIINEPEDRVFIGELPPKLERVRNNKTSFLSSIQIGRTAEVEAGDVWFDCALPLNHDMVAIIGNKGCGKSALADVLALAGNTARCEDFSFLNKKKFREKKLAENFEVAARWQDGTETVHNLQKDSEPNKSENVQYIPQTYLEKVCTETSVDESSAFQHELRKVIFSHITDTQRLGRETLEDLIAYKTEEIETVLSRHRQELGQINSTIAGLQQKATPDFKQQIEEAIAEKKKELQAHETNKPVEVAKPDNLSGEQKAAYDQIGADLAKQTDALQTMQQQIDNARRNLNTLTEHMTLVTKLESRLTTVESDVATHLKQSATQFETLGLKASDIVILKVNRVPLLTKKAALAADKSKIEASLAENDASNLAGRARAIQDKIAQLKGQLNAPNKRYQNYLQELQTWTARKQQIEGAAETAGSLPYLEAQLAYLATALPKEIVTAKQSRRARALDIFNCIAAIRDVYAELFAPVQQLIQDSIIIKEGFRLTFVSSIVQRGFAREFFDRHISQGVNGSFCGKETGEQRLAELMEDVDFNDAEQAITFVEKIEQHLVIDYRFSKRYVMLVSAQLRKHATVADLYDFLWSFGYLNPEYSLKLDGKDLTQLSPGERGALLLVFYLLVDKSEKPIIVDQPEENLDNQTVYRLLIPVIRDVKRRRQIIMVTHNPNIAVVCDAEQIIHASIDRPNGNRITYVSGSIENPVINKHLVDVLEGTRPAFDNRDAKYHP
jgi:ABC-type lipoprotein export system ATPase subunit